MRVLLVEDKPEASSQLMETLPQGELTLRLAPEAHTAVAQFRRETFDAVLIDLMLDPTTVSVNREASEYPGIQLGAQIRALNPSVLIVMYSANIGFQRETKFTHYAECVKAGADHVVSRGWLMSAAPATLASSLREWIKAKGQKERGGISVDIAPNVATQAVVERLGGIDTLREILRQAVPHFDAHKVEAVSGGYSGAIILRVLSSAEGGGQIDAQNIVKISSSSFNLADELRRQPFQGTILASRSVTPNTPMPFEVDGWYAFSVAEVSALGRLSSFY